MLSGVAKSLLSGLCAFQLTLFGMQDQQHVRTIRGRVRHYTKQKRFVDVFPSKVGKAASRPTPVCIVGRATLQPLYHEIHALHPPPPIEGPREEAAGVGTHKPSNPNTLLDARPRRGHVGKAKWKRRGGNGVAIWGGLGCTLGVSAMCITAG